MAPMADGGKKRILPFDPSARSKSSGADRKSPAAAGGNGAVIVSGWTTLYQLRIVLRDVEPPIWRRILIPGTLDLASLHRVIQTAMGWSDLDGDEDRGAEWLSRTSRADNAPPTDLDAGPSTLQGVLKAAGDSFIYASGSGDEWIHVVEVEEISRGTAASAQTVCIDGARNCPPADSDGPSAYADFLDALHDPDHESHLDALESAGGRFDPERFDLEETNRRLARLRR
jgi:hypothetical protein